MTVSDLVDRTPSNPTTIACDHSALDDPELHRRESERLWNQREELRKVQGGIALRFPGSMEYAERILSFIRRERRCCPFLTFQLVFEPEERGLWLAMTGDDGVATRTRASYRGPSADH